MMATGENILRRDFLKGAFAGATGLAALGVAGCAPQTPGSDSALSNTGSDEANIDWDREADVIVIGGGGSGLCSAIGASEQGGSTLLLEKAAMVGGTTALSAGITQAAGTEYQKKFTEYQDDTPQNHFEWYMALGEGRCDEELVRDLTFGMPEVIRWYVEDLGLVIGDFSGQSHVPYADEHYAVRIHRPDGEGGALIDAFKRKAEEQGVEIQTNTEVTHLITNSAGAVIGVEAKQGTKAIHVKANKGIIIATSNVDHNAEMAKRLCPQHAWALEVADCLSAPTNTGDGIRMGMEIGADLVNLDGSMNAILDLKLTSGQDVWGLIFVNKAGMRYVCEDAHYAYKTRSQFHMEKQTDHPCYAVWGESNLENCRAWDADTIQNAISEGIVISASSLEELADKIGVNPIGLQDTIDTWNNSIVPGGEDYQYGRISGFETIEGPTYYANRMRPEIMGPTGGLRIDVECRVLDTAGEPIPNLFAAGLCTGGWVGEFYPGSGTAMAANAHFGLKAGRNAAAL
ncbi:FAD-dependent oxidoreductase [uncultured Adlercreutzia sp.]|uniref:FAD-dependent oxidoreductase n=1 Tax=uncultured Adlercreutzia sp. TaxID=875803 RepID=UPI002674841E|nr:FAD-dependent oxidoreductase [uncultured Adlercreutzia sp.]